MRETTDTDLYRRWIDDLWNGPKDRTKLAEIAEEFVDEDFVGHWPTTDVVGPGKLAALIAAVKATHKGLEYSLEVGPFGGDGYVAARWISHGTVGAGENVYTSGNDILRIADGRLVECWVASPGV
ncbi:ester cyclase [Gordonia sp. HY285]|uniref:nuclear transport factor 2 family protein n=1 Tax=Gordonia liuliyuniae TaxID=2911517 RepID=UPI001F3F419C|nr:nuclear transport factor 2 family protein [Gordonia liuliyuniae]MCF8611733.1 ester cyclase [Gordonia liuliyuniae]